MMLIYNVVTSPFVYVPFLALIAIVLALAIGFLTGYEPRHAQLAPLDATPPCLQNSEPAWLHEEKEKVAIEDTETFANEAFFWYVIAKDEKRWQQVISEGKLSVAHWLERKAA